MHQRTSAPPDGAIFRGGAAYGTGAAGPCPHRHFPLGSGVRAPTVASSRNHRTRAEYYIKGITQGAIDAAEVIAWSDEVIVAATKTEDWMVEISSCGPGDRLKVLSLLNTVPGQPDAAELATLLTAKGLS